MGTTPNTQSTARLNREYPSPHLNPEIIPHPPTLAGSSTTLAPHEHPCYHTPMHSPHRTPPYPHGACPDDPVGAALVAARSPVSCGLKAALPAHICVPKAPRTVLRSPRPHIRKGAFWNVLKHFIGPRPSKPPTTAGCYHWSYACVSPWTMTQGKSRLSLALAPTGGAALLAAILISACFHRPSRNAHPARPCPHPRRPIRQPGRHPGSANSRRSRDRPGRGPQQVRPRPARRRRPHTHPRGPRHLLPRRRRPLEARRQGHGPLRTLALQQGRRLRPPRPIPRAGPLGRRRGDPKGRGRAPRLRAERLHRQGRELRAQPSAKSRPR